MNMSKPFTTQDRRMEPQNPYHPMLAKLRKPFTIQGWQGSFMDKNHATKNIDLRPDLSTISQTLYYPTFAKPRKPFTTQDSSVNSLSYRLCGGCYFYLRPPQAKIKEK